MANERLISPRPQSCGSIFEPGGTGRDEDVLAGFLHICPHRHPLVIRSGRRTGVGRLGRSYFHLHLVSDSTGETLIAASRAAAAQYQGVASIEHVYPLIRTHSQLDRVISDIDDAPGIVLFTLVDPDLSKRLEQSCEASGSPCLSVLNPILTLFQSYLGLSSTPRAGAQHMLNVDYFRRIDALNFTMNHDDGRLPADLNQADIILLGISRTSKTPTSIYLAQKGYKTTNLPLVPGIEIPKALTEPHSAFVVGLVASPERIAEIRRNRVQLLSDREMPDYVDRSQIANEIAYSRRLFGKYGWPLIDVTRRSIEETAATIIKMLHDKDATVTRDGIAPRSAASEDG